MTTRIGFIVLCVFGMISAISGKNINVNHPCTPLIEIENQTPCFFFGGYQLSCGIRCNRFRFRAEVQNSGSMDFGQFGLDNRDDRFRRSVDNISLGVLGDYFVNNWFYTTVSLESRHWIIQNRETSAKGKLRTLDGGLGCGGQFFPFKGPVMRHLFLQVSAIFYLRDSQTLSIEGLHYSISNFDCLPGIRIGARF